MRFEWDDQKAVDNLNKHGVSFGEATEVFYDRNAFEAYDLSHSTEEARFLIIGLSSRRLLYVCVRRARKRFNTNCVSSQS